MVCLKPPKLITIRQEPSFDEELAPLTTSHKRLDEVIFGATFSLAREPELCHKVPGTAIRIYKTAVDPDAPSVRIFFTLTDDEVRLLHVEFCEDVNPMLKYTEEG